MMDRICCAALEKICSLAPLGRYTVIDEEEIFEEFPQEVKNDEQELKRALKTLISEGYIDVKYSGGNLYCIAPLKAYTPPAEATPKPVENTEFSAGNSKKNPSALFTFLSAFAGGMAGSLLIALIFWLVNA